ncbi:bifunctional folylpolyglutamate synthase/dihydrofolate synthase [Haploplasma axanthum]|uniref:tetrahydrofolate synthase n=1 Tax=Haploplasma axanthum TaxID=29552 RepID=A0A449BE59_HAPAX|nr:folylpolyglutamate synthase/dihydrofolate synthase family protein [Haploplasma axanthum]VEU80743.1 Folylpolyglutamate synthase [Haploplasma axanthum]
MKFKNVESGIDWIQHQPKFREKTSLDYIKKAYDELKISFDKIKKIHIAGTNGKGSVSAFLTNILTSNNKKVGTFTSPYLVVFNERIRLNNVPIDDINLLKYINYIYDLNEQIFSKYSYRLSFFELLTLIAFKYFSDEEVDVIIMEVGIGGRLDATNIINYDVSIITSIGFDHMEQLGDTLEKIASEKLGILKEKGHLISGVNIPLKTQFINYANGKKASFLFIKERDIFPYTPHQFFYKDKLYELGLLGDYQRMNALIADNTVRYLYDYKDEQILPFLKTTRWDGRMEEIQENVYIDGAHNTHAITALMRNLEYIFKDKKITILFSALKDKKIAEMLDIIKKYDYKIVLTSFPDFRFKSLEEFETREIKYIENGYETFLQLIKNKEEDEVLIATGSLHFIGYLKQNIILNK